MAVIRLIGRAVILMTACGAVDVRTAMAQVAAVTELSSFGRAKVEALLDRKLPCLGCHRIGARGGRIGPDLSDVGTRLDRATLRTQILRPAGLMPRIPLDTTVLHLLVDFLAAQRTAPRPARQVAAGQPGNTGSGAQQLYERHCAACHGSRGDGSGWNAPFLDRPPTRHADAAVMGVRSDDRLFDAIYAGSAIMGGSARMPPFGATLTTQEIRLLVAYIRQLCRCRQPAWAGHGG